MPSQDQSRLPGHSTPAHPIFVQAVSKLEEEAVCKVWNPTREQSSSRTGKLMITEILQTLTATNLLEAVAGALLCSCMLMRFSARVPGLTLFRDTSFTGMIR